MSSTATSRDYITEHAPAVERAIRLIHQQGDIFELRCLEIPGKGRPYTAAGYFDDPALAARMVLELEQNAKPAGIYIIANRPDPTVIARSPNTLTNFLSTTTSDNDIVRRLWLPIDCDPVRPSGVCATEEQAATAVQLADGIKEFLTQEHGWPDPVVASSGNGRLLLYRIDLPNDAESKVLFERVLKALDQHGRQITSAAHVDRTMFNAARIIRLIGTLNRKGFSTPAQPHRRAELICKPMGLLVPVSVDRLRELAETVQDGNQNGNQRNGQAHTHTSNTSNGHYDSKLDVGRWLSARNITYKESETANGWRSWEIICPFDNGHGGKGETCIMQGPGGELAARCQHNTCSGNRWKEFKQRIGAPDPDHYDPPLQGKSKNTANATQDSRDAPRAAYATVRRISEVPRKEIDWVWLGRIPCGTLTLLDGDPGLGKSFASLDIAARETIGHAMPPDCGKGMRPPGNVMLLTAEDTIEHTIRPRLEALGADLQRVITLDDVGLDDKDRRLPMLPDDIALLHRLILEHGITLLIIDPFMAFLSSEVEANSDPDIRRVMHQLARMAEATGVAVLVIRHLNKLVHVQEAVYRGGGSIGIIGAARSALLIAKHPDDDQLRVLARVKGNLCAEPEALVYSIAVDGLDATVKWHQAADLKANELLGKSKAQRSNEAAEQKVKDDGAAVLKVLDEHDKDRKGMSRKQLRIRANRGETAIDRAVTSLLDDGILEEVEVEVTSGKGKKEPVKHVRRPVKNADARAEAKPTPQEEPVDASTS